MPLFLFRLKEEAVSGSLMAAEVLATVFGAKGRRPMTFVLLVHVPGIPVCELQLSLAEGRSRALQLGHNLLSPVLSRISTNKT